MERSQHMTLLEALAEFATGLQFENLPENVVSKANDCFFDFIGCYYGALKRDGNEGIVKKIAGWNPSGEAKIWGFSGTTGSAEAALAMGTLGYHLEFDDGVPLGGHWGSASIPSTYLGAVKAGRSGRDFLAALVASYEVGSRLSRIFSPRLLKNHVHFPCVMGAFASVTGYAKSLGYSTGKLSDSLALSGLFPLGTYSTATSGARGKGLYSGWPNYMGINACRLADIGLAGDRDIMEHPYGFGNTFGLGKVTPETARKALSDLGRKYLFMQTYFKPYPCCRWLHAPVHGVLALMQAHMFTRQDIERISVAGPEFIMMYNTKDGFDSKVTCQYSIPYSVGAAVFRGQLGIEEYEHPVRMDSELNDFIQRIHVSVDDTLQAAFPGSFAVALSIVLKDGRVIERLEGMPWGMDAPPSQDELIEKFTTLTSAALSQQEQEAWVRLYRTGFDVPGSFEKAQGLLAQAKF